MADVVSLSKIRKAKARADKVAEAAANRVKFGRTKAEKLRDTAEREQLARKTDAHRRED